jgi:hypothetical protein
LNLDKNSNMEGEIVANCVVSIFFQHTVS